MFEVDYGQVGGLGLAYEHVKTLKILRLICSKNVLLK
jgi:hypothetical protein